MTYRFQKNGKLKEFSTEELAAMDSKTFVIVRDQGTLEDGTPYWAYIAVRPSRYAEFMRLTKAGQPINFAEYGNVLKHGFESSIPPAIKEEMAREHGCSDDFMTTIAKEVKEQQSAFMKKQEDARIGDIVAMLQKKQSGG